MSVKQNYIVVICPHCNGSILILEKEINCKIFRHGVLKSTKKQINPHLEKKKCDRLFAEGLIFGCGKPFRLNDDMNAVICDYI